MRASTISIRVVFVVNEVSIGGSFIPWPPNFSSLNPKSRLVDVGQESKHKKIKCLGALDRCGKKVKGYFGIKRDEGHTLLVTADRTGLKESVPCRSVTRCSMIG